MYLFYSLLTQVNSLIFSTYTSNLSTSTSYSISSSNKLKQKLNKYAIALCKSGSFASLVSNTIHFLNKPVDSSHRADISYFLWIIKFIVGNFLLKQLDSVETLAVPYELVNIDETRSNVKKLFINDTSQSTAVTTKRVIFSYDLLSFLCFSMLDNFEKLIFDSNSRNMEALKSKSTEDKSNKIVNVRCLKLLYLSIYCIYELIQCIHVHLDHLNSTQYQKV